MGLINSIVFIYSVNAEFSHLSLHSTDFFKIFSFRMTSVFERKKGGKALS